MSESSDSSQSSQARASSIRQLLAEKFKGARRALDLTQKQLGEIAGLRQTLISKMERGQCLTVANIVVVAEALDFSLAQFFIDLKL